MIGQKEVLVNGREDIFNICKLVEKERAVRATNMNHESSRTHCFMNIKLYQKAGDKVHYSQLRFVDLCGSERKERANTCDWGDLEAAMTNFNLLALQRVITNVINLPKPIKNGKELPASTFWKLVGITRILKSSFNGLAHTAFIYCLS